MKNYYRREFYGRREEKPVSLVVLWRQSGFVIVCDELLLYLG